jgi:hypothetical protein
LKLRGGFTVLFSKTTEVSELPEVPEVPEELLIVAPACSFVKVSDTPAGI